MHSHITRPRLIVALAFSLALFALLLGVAFPASPPDAGAVVGETRDGPRLLVSEFTDRVSTLWLVEPTRPSERQSFLQIEHAAGWEISGAVSPAGSTLIPHLAYVVLEPGRQDPETEASLYLSNGGPPRLLREGLDLRGGATWSADGESILVREVRLDQSGSRSYAVVEVRVSDGRESRHALSDALSGSFDVDLFSLHVVGRPSGGPLYAALIGRAGTTIVEFGAEGGGTLVKRQISTGLTRDWALSPDGTQLAFTEQTGVLMQVRTVALEGALEGAQPALRAATNSGQVLLDEAEIGSADLAGSEMGSAAPVWRTNESLSVGVFRQGASGGELRVASAASGDGEADSFALPVAWSSDGRFLALRSFEGSGPGSIRGESAAVLDGGSIVSSALSGGDQDVGEMRKLVPGEHVLILGWWQ